MNVPGPDAASVHIPSSKKQPGRATICCFYSSHLPQRKRDRENDNGNSVYAGEKITKAMLFSMKPLS